MHKSTEMNHYILKMSDYRVSVNCFIAHCQNVKVNDKVLTSMRFCLLLLYVNKYWRN